MREFLRRLHPGPAPTTLLPQVIGVIGVTLLLLGLLRGMSGVVQRLLARRAVVLESYAILPRSATVPLRATGDSGFSGSFAAVVILHNLNGFLTASDVTVSVAPSAGTHSHRISTTLPALLPSQTVAVTLSTRGDESLGRPNITVGRWQQPRPYSPALPDTTWKFTPPDFLVRVSNQSTQRSPAVTLVGAFFNDSGSILGAGVRTIGPLAPGATRTFELTPQVGSDPVRARPAVFEVTH